MYFPWIAGGMSCCGVPGVLLVLGFVVVPFVVVLLSCARVAYSFTASLHCFLVT